MFPHISLQAHWMMAQAHDSFQGNSRQK